MVKNDELNYYEQKLKSLAEKNILMAANLISGVIEDNFNDGFTWCVETIKNSNFASLAIELDLNKAIMFLKQGDLSQAIETLKYFERKESSIAVNAAINLTFIYLLVGVDYIVTVKHIPYYFLHYRKKTFKQLKNMRNQLRN